MKTLFTMLLFAIWGCSTTDRKATQEQLQQKIVQPDGYPFQTKMVNLNGFGEMHYIDEGNPEGETLLLLHGNPTWSYLWRKSVPLLGERYRVIAPDLIGHGRSSSVVTKDPFRLNLQAVKKFIETLNLRRIILVGHDWGGAIAYSLASQVVGVRGVIVCEPVLPRARNQLSFLTRTFRGTPILEWYMRYTDLFISGVAFDLQSQESEVDTVIDSYRRPFAEKGNRELQILWWNALPVADEDLNDNYQFLVESWDQFKMSALPKLVIYGDPGMTVHPSDISLLESDMTESTFAFIGNGSHFFPEKYPERFARIASDWVETTFRREPQVN